MIVLIRSPTTGSICPGTGGSSGTGGTYIHQVYEVHEVHEVQVQDVQEVQKVGGTVNMNGVQLKRSNRARKNMIFSICYVGKWALSKKKVHS